MMANAHAGHRPAEWWLYEKGTTRRDREDEADALYEMGELSEAELAKLLPRWRELYEQAWEPDFAYSIGHASPDDTFTSWLEGAAARRAQHRWAGIPRGLIKEWNAERKRRTKTIHKLKVTT